MLKTGKFIIIAFAVYMLISICCGCASNTTRKYLFKTKTGDAVAVWLDSSGIESQYRLKAQDDEFSVLRKNTELVRGTFYSTDSIDNFRLSIKNDPVSKMLKDNGEELWWISYNPDKNAMEYEALFRISDKTCVLIGGVLSEDIKEEDIENAIRGISVKAIPQPKA